MAYEGLPVVVGGDTHYRGFGFTTDPTDPAAYRSTLADLDSLSATPETRRRARRYAHLLFVGKHVDFPYCTTEGAKSYRLRPVEHDALAPGADPWDRIVESILDHEEVLVG
jgi:hypothetical protein